MLMVSPLRFNPMMAVKMASGIEVQTTITLRQLPRNAKIINETRIEESTASRTTLMIAARTNTD